MRIDVWPSELRKGDRMAGTGRVVESVTLLQPTGTQVRFRDGSCKIMGNHARVPVDRPVDVASEDRQRWGGPSPWAGMDTRTDAQKLDDDPERIRDEIVRLSGRLPADDPLRVAIACAPVRKGSGS